jgi:hypothetical protein
MDGMKIMTGTKHMKICSVCGLKKTNDCFSAKQSKCRPCHAIYDKEYCAKNKAEIKERKALYRIDNMEFIKERDHIYYEDNQEKIRVYNAEYYELHKDEIKEQAEQYRQTHKNEINEHARKRRKNDIEKKLRTYLSTAIGKALKTKKSSKQKGSCLQYLSYTIEELKMHIEKQFESWMNWDNRGVYNVDGWNDEDQLTWKWNLDHIIPQSDLPFMSMTDDNFQKCWALSNLRPYSAKQNIFDGACRARHQK